jgi:BlaI family transcriptional regulator, penicillinase repressor
MADRTPDVTESELLVLDVLWESPAATIRQITQQIYDDYSASLHATVQKLLERLEAKGYVARDRSSFAHRFSATVGKQELIGRQLESLADKLTGGALTPLLLTLAGRTRLSAAERRQLRELIDKAR